MEEEVLELVTKHRLSIDDLDMFGSAMREIHADPDTTHSHDLRAWLVSVKQGLLKDDRYKDLNDLQYVELCNDYEIDITEGE